MQGTGNGTQEEPGSYVGGNGFGIDCADLNNDGLMDIFITNISHPISSDHNRKWSEPSQVLINQGSATGWTFQNEFVDRPLPFNEGDGALIDFNNDGRLDLSISRDRKYEGSYDDPDQKAWFGLMRQHEDGSFASVGVIRGINDTATSTLLRMKNAQNHAWSDIDHDGDQDLPVGGRDTGGGRPNLLFENLIGSQNRWLAVRLIRDGTVVDRDAVGARMVIDDGTRFFSLEVRATRGMYNSMDTKVLHFGFVHSWL